MLAWFAEGKLKAHLVGSTSQILHHPLAMLSIVQMLPSLHENRFLGYTK